MAKVLVIGSYADSLLSFRGPLLEYLRALGHAVTVAIPGVSPATQAALADMGVGWRDYPLRRTGLNPVEDAQSLWHLAGIMREVRPDVVLTYTIKPIVYGTLAARAAVPGARCYAMVTGVGYAFSAKELRARLSQGVARALLKLSLPGNARVFFQNPDNRDLFVGLGLVAGERCELIDGSGVDLEHYAVAPLPEEVSFLMVGRLLRDKGLLEYVEAARAVRRRRPTVRFALAGWLDDNPKSITAEELEGWVREGVVEYLGRLEDVRPAMARAAVYVLPSYAEGTPRSVLEAMSMGRPVITTDAPGCRETVRPGENGWLVAVGEVGGLVEAMERFLEAPGLCARMGQRSREMAETRFDVRRVNAQMAHTMGLVPGKAGPQA